MALSALALLAVSGAAIFLRALFLDPLRSPFSDGPELAAPSTNVREPVYTAENVKIRRLYAIRVDGEQVQKFFVTARRAQWFMVRVLATDAQGLPLIQGWTEGLLGDHVITQKDLLAEIPPPDLQEPRSHHAVVITRPLFLF